MDPIPAILDPYTKSPKYLEIPCQTMDFPGCFMFMGSIEIIKLSNWEADRRQVRKPWSGVEGPPDFFGFERAARQQRSSSPLPSLAGRPRDGPAPQGYVAPAILS